MQRLLKPSEVADRLAVSRAWVYEAAKVGRIPAVRIGGEDGPLRFVAEDVQQWIDDARAEWTPGHSTAQTRQPASLASQRRRSATRRPRAAPSGQQSLI
jgi:excisionase family DNA binding protein